MWKSLIGARSTIAAATTATFIGFSKLPAHLDESDASPSREMKKNRILQQPAFVSLSSSQKPGSNQPDVISLNELVLISGSSHVELSKEISQLIGVPVASADLKRFADGEVSIQIHDNLRGKDVFIVQSCTAPVNDSIMELLLTVSTARRSGARRVIAVIPYFGYKHHRRGASISTRHHSRFLSSSAMDFAKMLQEMGVDRVISVDLQRPGQGHEACFFDNTVPLEAILSTDHMVDHFLSSVNLQEPVVVVTPNNECVKKARNFQLRLQGSCKSEVKLLAFFPKETGSGEHNIENLEILGKAENIVGADVVIVDDMVDTAGTLSSLSHRLKLQGARNVFVCASHGLFTESSIDLIEKSPVKQVVVTNTLPMPKITTSKIIQVSIAPMLAHVILAEHFRSIDQGGYQDEEFEMED